MPHSIGDGLPSSLTPERLKEVLGFAKTQEREFAEALDRIAYSSWNVTETTSDFYPRLHALVSTAEGRIVYEKARDAFERAKRKRSGRADLPRRLVLACHRSAPDLTQCQVLSFGLPNPSSEAASDCQRALAQAGRWDLFAELVWGIGLTREASGDYVLDALETYPAAAPFLEDVRASIYLVGNRSEPTGPITDETAEEAARTTALVADIQRQAGALTAEHLDPQLLDTLRDDVTHLIDIAEVHAAQRRDIKRLQTRISTWRESHLTALTDRPLFLDLLAELETLADTGAIDHDSVEERLTLFKTALDADVHHKEKQAALTRAVKAEDYNLVRSLSTELDLLKATRNQAFAASKSSVTRSHGKSPDPIDQHTSGTSPTATESPQEGHDTQDDASEPGPDTVPCVTVESKSPTNQETEISHDVDAVQYAPNATSDADHSTGVSDDQSTTSDGEEGLTTLVIEAAVAKALERDRFGVAYHLAEYAPDALPGSDTITFIASSYVTDDRDSLPAELMNLSASLRRPEPARNDYTALAATSALIPALMAPGWPIAQLLSSLEAGLDSMPSLRTLVGVAAEVSQMGLHLPVELLRAEASIEEEWNSRADILWQDTQRWIEAERRSNVVFVGATNVWHRILEDWTVKKRSSIGHMFSLFARPAEKTEIQTVKAIAEHWRQNGDSEIDRVDRAIRGAAPTKQITGSARLRLREKIREAIVFADRWNNLLETRPDPGQESYVEQVDKLRSAVRQYGETANQEINSLDTPTARQAAKLLDRYIDMFDHAENGEPPTRVRLRDLLDGDLYAEPTTRFDDIGMPVPETLPSIGVLLCLSEQDRLDFPTAIEERAKSGDFRGAEFALDYVERRHLLDQDDTERIRARLDEHRSHTTEILATQYGDTRNRLDVSYARGILSASEHAQLAVEVTPPELLEIGDFAPLFDQLQVIHNKIDDGDQRFREEIRARIESLQVSPRDRDRIRDLITANRFQVAQDYIDRIERGEQLPNSDGRANRSFDSFFPTFVDRYVAFRTQQPDALLQIRTAVERRQAAGPVDARELSPDAARDGDRLLAAWSSLCASRTTTDTLLELFTMLGFANARIESAFPPTLSGTSAFQLLTLPVSDREIVQLPDFGSRAGGRYRLLVIRDRDSQEAIVREAGEWTADGRPPNLVLFLQVLDADARRDLAREFRAGDYHPTVVLDEALVAFLAGWPGRPQGAFFDCASAFAFAQPFDPNAYEVPPEMFFGRKTERDKIVATSGGDMTHFVYGGRRLGKTALFKDIAQEYRSRAPDELVLFLNLKGKGIGHSRPTTDLWRLFSQQLSEHDVVSSGTVRYDSFQTGVQRWLNDNPRRRILFLVDEADDFLDADRLLKPNYPVLEQMKQLMEDTARRFKVVFAGLHNVQRAARDSNTPLAHLGEAVRVGPMLPETDDEEIEKLIRAPIETLGYRFDSRDSVIRIAAETNYYPALAQQFCKDLLRVLREKPADIGPPFTILPEQIDRAFNSKETRDRIRNLFSWTIQLDPRYEFLAHLIARNSFYDGSAKPSAMSIEAIRDNALQEWPQGFQSDGTYWAFEVLLDEMVGLGILRRVGEEDFIIRTRNLRTLLGNEQEIERRFMDAKDREPPLRFDPAQFRRTLDDENKRLSSLTAGHEDRLLSFEPGIALLFGTWLAGVDFDRVRDSLFSAASGAGRFVEPLVFESAPDKVRFGAEIGKLSRRRESGVHFILVNMCDGWAPDLLEVALDFVETLDARNRIVRPVFLGGPTEAWKWLNERRTMRGRTATISTVWLGPCAKGFAYWWLKDLEAPAYSDLEAQGGDPPWPVVVEVAARSKDAGSVADATDIVLREGNRVADVLDLPMAKAVFRVLFEYQGSMNADDLSEMSELVGDRVSVHDSASILGWADRLGIVCRHGAGYRLHPAYAKGLSSIFNG